MQVHGPLSPSQLGSPLNKHQKVATEVMLIAGFYCNIKIRDRLSSIRAKPK